MAEDLERKQSPLAAEAPATAALRELRAFTAARIGLGRTGVSLSTREQLAFQLDHAAARDAVHLPLDAAALLESVRQRGWPTLPLLSSACVEPDGARRRPYLQRSDLGRLPQSRVDACTWGGGRCSRSSATAGVPAHRRPVFACNWAQCASLPRCAREAFAGYDAAAACGRGAQWPRGDRRPDRRRVSERG